MRHSRNRASRRDRLISILHRRTSRWWLTALIATIAIGWTISTTSRAERTSAAWGERRRVAVALTDLEPGHIVTAEDLSFTARPIAMIPDGAAESPIGRTVTRHTVRDEVLLESRLAGGAAHGPTALLDERMIAFSIPRDTTTPAVEIGDRVTVFAPAEVVASASRSGGPAIRITESSIVIAVTDTSVMVGVDVADAAEVARSMLVGAVLLGLTG